MLKYILIILLLTTSCSPTKTSNNTTSVSNNLMCERVEPSLVAMTHEELLEISEIVLSGTISQIQPITISDHGYSFLTNTWLFINFTVLVNNNIKNTPPANILTITFISTDNCHIRLMNNQQVEIGGIYTFYLKVQNEMLVEAVAYQSIYPTQLVDI